MSRIGIFSQLNPIPDECSEIFIAPAYEEGGVYLAVYKRAGKNNPDVTLYLTRRQVEKFVTAILKECEKNDSH